MSTPLDQPVVIRFNTYSDAARTVLADPTAITVTVKAPDGTETAHVWPSGDVVRESLGIFTYTDPGTTPGTFSVHIVSTGAVASADDTSFTVRPKYGFELVTVGEVKTEINETSNADDDEIQGFIDAAVDVVENIVGPVVPKSYTEWKDGGSTTLILDRYPVVTVDSLTEYVGTTAQTLAAEPLGSVTYTDLGYRVDLATGVLTRFSGGTQTVFNRGTGNVKVTYTAGRTSVPAGVRMATLEFIRRWWTSSQASGSVTYPVDLEAPTLDGTGPSIRTLLAPFRKAPHV